MKTIYYNTRYCRFQDNTAETWAIRYGSLGGLAREDFQYVLAGEYPDYDFKVESDGCVYLLNVDGNQVKVVLISD